MNGARVRRPARLPRRAYDSSMGPRRTHRRIALAVGASIAVAGCGGSLSLGFGGDWDDPPRVSLAAAADRAPAGSTLRVVAAASDDFGIDRVEFFRQDGEQWIKVATDGTAPYQIDLVVPDDGRAELALFARATDDVGQQADSGVVAVIVDR